MALQYAKYWITVSPSNLIPRCISIYAKELNTDVQTKTCMWMFMAAIVTIAKDGNNPNIHQKIMLKKLQKKKERKCSFPYSRIVLSCKEEQRTDICYKAKEPWKHDTKWKKSYTKDHILYDSIYMKCPEQENP